MFNNLEGGSLNLGGPMRSEQECTERTESVLLDACVLKEKKVQKRMKEYPKNIPRCERNVLENMKVQVRQKEDLNDLTSSVMHRFMSYEVD